VKARAKARTRRGVKDESWSESRSQWRRGRGQEGQLGGERRRERLAAEGEADA